LIWRAFEHFEFLNAAFVTICPLAAFAWFFYVRAIRQNALQTPSYHWRPIFISCLPWLAFLIVPWFQFGTYRVANTKYLNAVAIKLERSSCFGSCPAYSVWLYGTGSVTYIGQRFVRTKGPEQATIPQERVLSLLQSFDRERFFSMEDKAFLNGFDAPYASITISVGARIKTVSGDTIESGAWPKSGLFKLAQEIDDAAGTNQWVVCHGKGCVYQ
jgi:hypothetical protein